MKPKSKALVFNFIAFVGIFLIIRYSLNTTFELSRIVLVLTSAVLTSILAPKFIATRHEGEERLFMKWVFYKNPKEL